MRQIVCGKRNQNRNGNGNGKKAQMPKIWTKRVQSKMKIKTGKITAIKTKLKVMKMEILIRMKSTEKSVRR